MSGDRIIVTEPNGVQRTRPITSWGLTIGRGDDNDLVVAYGAVSRKHAVITSERGRYYVADLGSTTGTYLGNARLEPNTPTSWLPGQPLRIGDVVIRLEQTATADSKSDTFHGVFVPVDARKGAGTPKSSAMVWILIAVVIIFILVAAGLAVYFLFLV